MALIDTLTTPIEKRNGLFAIECDIHFIANSLDGASSLGSACIFSNATAVTPCCLAIAYSAAQSLDESPCNRSCSTEQSFMTQRKMSNNKRYISKIVR